MGWVAFSMDLEPSSPLRNLGFYQICVYLELPVVPSTWSYVILPHAPSKGPDSSAASCSLLKASGASRIIDSSFSCCRLARWRSVGAKQQRSKPTYDQVSFCRDTVLTSAESREILRSKS